MNCFCVIDQTHKLGKSAFLKIIQETKSFDLLGHILMTVIKLVKLGCQHTYKKVELGEQSQKILQDFINLKILVIIHILMAYQRSRW